MKKIYLVLGLIVANLGYSYSYTRNVLVEEFTTERCSNCPRAAVSLERVLQTLNNERGERVTAIARHSGYYTDWLTQNADVEMEWLYGGNRYAPAFMVDRTVFDGESVPVFENVDDGALLEKRVREQLLKESKCEIKIIKNFDSWNNKLTLTVNLERESTDCLLDSRLTIALVEDNVLHRNQQGEIPDDYNHQNVLRYISSTWGEPIEWDGVCYGKNTKLDISDEWKSEDMRIVVFVSKYNGADMRDNRIENMKFVSLIDDAAVNIIEDNKTYFIVGSGNITSSNGCEVEIYNLSGTKVSNTGLNPGVYIAKSGDIVSKVMIR